MSLLNEAYELFTMVDKISQSDGEGGFYVDYVDGAKIQAALTLENSNIAKVAEAISEKREYRVITRRNVVFQQYDLIKRNSDGQVFRIYYKNNNKTPKSATLDMRETFAEEWNIPI